MEWWWTLSVYDSDFLISIIILIQSMWMTLKSPQANFIFIQGEHWFYGGCFEWLMIRQPLKNERSSNPTQGTHTDTGLPSQTCSPTTATERNRCCPRYRCRRIFHISRIVHLIPLGLEDTSITEIQSISDCIATPHPTHPSLSLSHSGGSKQKSTSNKSLLPPPSSLLVKKFSANPWYLTWSRSISSSTFGHQITERWCHSSLDNRRPFLKKPACHVHFVSIHSLRQGDKVKQFLLPPSSYPPISEKGGNGNSGCRQALL